jgi:3-oxoacyl-[acyl-carrier protein] reductase
MGAAGNGSGDAARACALVTGASRGIGAAIARALAADGRPVAVNYSGSETDAKAVVAQIEAVGGQAFAVQGDVSAPDDVDAAFAAVEERFGPVLVLVNNAGIRFDRLVTGLEHDEWARTLDVNLTGAFNTTKRALPTMVRHRFGRVVNISSISSIQPLPAQSAYAVSKAGLEALTRSTAIEVARRGVTVNAVAPGVVDTSFLPASAEDWMDSLPSKRAATVDEVAGLVAYVASEQAAYLNGAVIRLDGGLTAGIGMVRQKPRKEARSINT